MKVFGIPLKVDPSFLFLVVMLGYSRLNNLPLLAIWIGVVFVSIVIHELGHAFAGRAFGLTPAILIQGMGGLTYWTENKALSAARHIAISFAGPLAGFIVGGIVFAVAVTAPPAPDTLAAQVVNDLLWVNIGWGILNLVPMLPLDGGNIMKSVFDILSRGRGLFGALVVSVVVAVAVLVLAIVGKEPWIGILGALFLYQNGQALYEYWQSTSDPTTAYRMARTMAHSGRLDDALTWLDRAVKGGFRDVAAVESDPVFESVRPLPEYRRIVDSMS